MEQIEHISIGRISVDRQVRKIFDPASLTGLAESLKQVGTMQPLRVRKTGDTVTVIDGERRYRAAMLAGFTTLPVIVENGELSETAVLHRQLVANLQREDLKPVERALGIQALMQASGWNGTQTANQLGLSAATVTRLLAVLTLPQEIQQRVDTGEIPASAAYELSRMKDTVERNAKADAIACGQLTRDDIAAAGKAAREASENKEKETAGRVTALLGDGRSVTVAAKHLNLDCFITTLEDLLAKAKKCRQQDMTLATFANLLKDQRQAVPQQSTVGGPYEAD